MMASKLNKPTTYFGMIVAIVLFTTLLAKLFGWGFVGLTWFNIILLMSGLYLFGESLVLFGKIKSKSWKQYLHIFSFGLALVLVYIVLSALFSGGIESPAGRDVNIFFLAIILIDVVIERFVD